MAIFHEDTTATEHPRYCPRCGRECVGERYCSECGHAIDPAVGTTEATSELPRTIPPQPVASGPPPPYASRSRSRMALIAPAGVLLVAVVTVLVVILLNGSSSPNGAGQSSSYRQKLGSALAPVMSANQTLSSMLQALDGSKKALSAAVNATSQAQSAVVAARGAGGVLTAPTSDATLSQQVQQALTEENGYLQALSSTLSDPSGQSASQLRPLLTATQSAMVPLAAVAPGATSSLGGIDNVLGWAGGATALAQRQAQAAQRKAQPQTTATSGTTTAVPQQAPAVSPSSSPSGLTACDQNISVNSNTTCPFADNVFNQYAIDVQQAGTPGSYVVYAYSPSSGQGYYDTCNYNPANQIVLCSHGSDLTQFPYWAAEVYQTH